VKQANRPVILKFGGTSLGSAERIRGITSIVAERRAARPVVVVSAMAGVTDDLVRATELAARGDREAQDILERLAERHLATARTLVRGGALGPVVVRLRSWVSDLASLLHGVSLVRDCSPRVRDAVLAHGELFSATLVAAALRESGVPADVADARTFLVTDDSFGHAVVDRSTSDDRIREALASFETIPVVTGFIAATADGTTSTLGRGGSDHTATLLGAVLRAEVVEIWTDVDGVMSADPRLVPGAFPLPRLSYTELMELSHFGAKVVFPPAVNPAREAGIPLVIRNTLNRTFPGTWVTPDTTREATDRSLVTMPVRGISSINRVALCRLQGAGMLGVPGIAGRLFGALARDGISVILICQASSEHSICFALEPASAARARRLVDAEFAVERKAGVVDTLVVEDDHAVIAAVGEAMRDTPGIAGRVFDVLGRNGINVRAIAQGSSELNISLVIHRDDEERALRLIHDAFYLPRTRTVQVFVAGTGRVGAALLDQMTSRVQRLGDHGGLRLLVGGIARSRFASMAPHGVALASWRSVMEDASEPSARIIDTALQSPNAHRVFVDCTASSQIAAAYEALLGSGVAIVTANKIGLSGSMESYTRLRLAAQKGNGLFAETTVGAGLPVLRPIADLIATGDSITRIEGVLSGTLSFLFARVTAGRAFSEAVREAFDRGFTEPDPREDLSGRDVARKLLILAREAGFEIEPEDVRVVPVLPGDGWGSLSIEDFWLRLPDADASFEERRQAARDANGVLSYVATIDANGAEVAIRQLAVPHPAAALAPGDNLIAVTSLRYAERPLVVRGPGAGPEVTAAGVFADIIRAGNEAR
jgi:aspartokinase/homoserine dehydrogenase 1